jgi:hypothetical protein
MEGKDCAYLGNGHLIEFCSTVPERNSHVDIPLRDLAPIVIEALRRDLLNEYQTALVLDAVVDSMLRQENGLAKTAH